MLKSTERLERLVAMVPWLIENNGTSIKELAKRFQYPENTLIEDLTKVLFFVGPHPHSPGDLIEINLYEGEVWISQAQFLSKPLRLTAGEAFSLLVKGKMLQNILGSQADNEALASALEKLSAAVNIDPSDIVLEKSVRDSNTFKVIQEGIHSKKKMKISYYSFNSDRNSERVIHPVAISGKDRYIYLDAFCQTATDYRIFRVDRIVEIELLEEVVDVDHHQRRAELEEAESIDLDFSFTGKEQVALKINRQDDWIISKYPTTNVDVVNEQYLIVTLPVSTEKWLGRLLLRISPETEVLEASGGISKTIGCDLADKILIRYRESNNGSW